MHFKNPLGIYYIWINGEIYIIYIFIINEQRLLWENKHTIVFYVYCYYSKITVPNKILNQYCTTHKFKTIVWNFIKLCSRKLWFKMFLNKQFELIYER